MARTIKILLAKLGLDVHNRGVVTVARELRDSGMEVVYIGNAPPHAIIKTAIQEDADVVGVSSLAGAHMTLGKKLIEAANKEKIKDRTCFLMGGVFSPADAKKMSEMGFDGVFMPGSTKEEIVSSVCEMVSKKHPE